MESEQNHKNAEMPTDIIDGKPKIMAQNEILADLIGKKLEGSNYGNITKNINNSKRTPFCCLVSVYNPKEYVYKYTKVVDLVVLR